MLMRRLAGEQRRLIARHGACRVTQVLYEVALRRFGVERLAISVRSRRRADHLSPLAIEVDELLGDDLTLRRV